MTEQERELLALSAETHTGAEIIDLDNGTCLYSIDDTFFHWK